MFLKWVLPCDCFRFLVRTVRDKQNMVGHLIGFKRRCIVKNPRNACLYCSIFLFLLVCEMLLLCKSECYVECMSSSQVGERVFKNHFQHRNTSLFERVTTIGTCSVHDTSILCIFGQGMNLNLKSGKWEWPLNNVGKLDRTVWVHFACCNH